MVPAPRSLIAGAFGLVHGLGFASSLGDHDLGRTQAAWTLLGFNIGIELAQLALLTLVLPWLLILARTRSYRAFRLGGAAFAGALASAWLLERSVGLANPTQPLVDWMQSQALLLLVALASLALAARAFDRPAQSESARAGAEPASEAAR